MTDAAVLPQRQVGRTPVLVSAVGFGGASAGNLYRETSDAEAAAAVDAAWAGGIRYFDTAQGKVGADKVKLAGDRATLASDRESAVNPGTADTPWVARLLDAADDPAAERVALAARQPHGRLVTADEVAQVVVYLASPRAGSTTGAEYPVDGGLSHLRPRPRS